MIALCTFFKPSQSNRLLLDLFAAFFYFLACFTYNTPLLLGPFVLLAILIFRKKSSRQHLISPVILLTFVCVVSFILVLSASLRKSSITIFSDALIQSQYSEYRAQFSPQTQRLLGNQYAYYIYLMGSRFYGTFSFNFLVSHGGNHPWHSILGRGHIYTIEFVLFYVGLLFLLFHFVGKKKPIPNGRTASIICLLLLITSTFPSIITTDSPHATRSLFTLTCIIAIGCYGVAVILSRLNTNRTLQWLFAGTIAVVITYESLFYFQDYFKNWQNSYPPGFLIGILEQVEKAKKTYPNKKITIRDTTNSLYIVLSWYDQIPPDVFHSTLTRSGRDTVGITYGETVAEYRFIHQDPWRYTNTTIIDLKDGKDWLILDY